MLKARVEQQFMRIHLPLRQKSVCQYLTAYFWISWLYTPSIKVLHAHQSPRFGKVGAGEVFPI